MTPGSSKWTVVFYTSRRGDSPPLEFIKGLQRAERAKVARYIDLLREVGTQISMPQARHLRGQLWELRPSPYRLIYFAYTGRQFVILHAFRKKTQRTPRQEIEIAEGRLKEILEGGRK